MSKISPAPSHPIEFTGNAAPNKARKPLPQWFIGWVGGFLMGVLGAASGGSALVALLWMSIVASDDMGSFIGIFVVLIVAATAGAIGGCVYGVILWAIIRYRAHKSAGE